MDSINIYISIPALMPEKTKQDIAKRVKDSCPFTVTVNYWSTGTYYDPLSVDKCDIFIVVTEYNTWQTNINFLPSGIRKELKLAETLKKPIFLAYTTASQEMYFYATALTKESLSGIAGSSTHLAKKVTDFVNTRACYKKGYKITEKLSPEKGEEETDQRLLL